MSRDSAHRFSKPPVEEIHLIAGLGIEGDAHAGVTVQHRSRMRRDPSAPNLRQVHLIHSELFDEVAERGHAVAPGDMGENVTTAGVALLDLPSGTRLRLGSDAVVEVTGLRNPCVQIDRFDRGLLKAVLGQSEDGNVVRKGGVMSIVLTSGVVRPGDPIEIELPPPPFSALEPV